jgi:hypothetical protein
MNENENNTTELEEDDVMLPEGWADGDDFFDDASWTGGQGQADEQGETANTSEEDVTGETEGSAQAPTEGNADEQSAAEGEAATGEAAPTTEPTEAPGETGTDDTPAPTTEQGSQAEPNKKLKFKARVDRNDLDVEMDESELPTMYQKAQVVDRVQARLAKVTPSMEKAERLAKAMGFDSVDAMLDSAESNYRDTEVSRLVGEGVHEEVAKDMIARRIRDRESGQAPVEPSEPSAPGTAPAAQDAPAAPQGRNFKDEVAELLSVRPDLRGAQLPQEVVNACVQDGKRLFIAYSEYERQQEKAENERLAKRVKVLEQNAAAAARSPVSGVSGGGATDTKPKDDFLLGFDADDY